MEMNFSNVDHDGLYNLQLEGASLLDCWKRIQWNLPHVLEDLGDGRRGLKVEWRARTPSRLCDGTSALILSR